MQTRRSRRREKAFESSCGFGRWRRASFVRKNNPATRVRCSPHVGFWCDPRRRVTARARLEVCVGHLLHVLARLAQCGPATAWIPGAFTRVVSCDLFVQVAVTTIEQCFQVRCPGLHILCRVIWVSNAKALCRLG